MANKTIQVLLSERYSEKLFPNTVLDLIEGGIGVFGNITVLVMYSRYIVDKSMTRYFIPILAFVDLLGCLSNVVHFHLDNTMRYIYPGVHLCKTLFFLMIMSGGISAHLIFAIALQRYLMICRPFGQQMTRKYCRIAVVTISLFSFGYAAPVLKFAGLNKGWRVSFCHLDDGSHGSNVMVPYFGSLLLLSFINIVATFCMYIPVVKTIYRTLSQNNIHGDRANVVQDQDIHVSSKYTQNIGVEKMTTNDARLKIKDALESNREQNARKRISVMFLIIIIVYAVSYLTSLSAQIYVFTAKEAVSGYRFNISVFCLRFNLLNHIANPYIYWFHDIRFRKELKKLCCRSD